MHTVACIEYHKNRHIIHTYNFLATMASPLASETEAVECSKTESDGKSEEIELQNA